MGNTARKFRAVVVSEPLEDNLSDFEKERIVRRRLVATTGRCPCGALLELPDELRPGFQIIAVEHEPDCPAADPDDAA